MRRIGNLFRGGRRDGGGRCQASRLARRALCTAGTAALLLAVLATPATAGAGDPDGDRRPVQVVTIAGTGELGFSGDGGDALDARLNRFLKLDVDSQGNVYIADSGNGRVRAVSPDGAIDTVPGTRGQRAPENDGPDVGGFIFSPSDRPQSVAVGDDDTLYVAADESIRRRDADGRFTVITTSDGEADFFGGEGGGDGGPASEAFVYEPGDIALDDDGNLYIADTNNDRIRKVDTSGTITTVAGGGDLDRDEAEGGPAVEASVFSPETVAVDSGGNVFFTEGLFSSTVRMVDTDGTITTVAGVGSEGEEGDEQASGDGGPATEAELVRPEGVAVDPAGNLYIGDTGHGVVRRVDADGTITTFAGGGDLWADEADNAPATQASPWEPIDVSVDAAGGNAYLIEGRHQSVRRVDADGILSTVAGNSYLSFDEGGFSGDGGPATGAELNTPGGTAVDAAGNLYIADSYNSRIRKVAPDGTISTIAGTGEPRDEGDGGPATDAGLTEPRDIAVDADGTIYVVSSRSERVRRIDPDGTITTINEIGSTGAGDAGGEAHGDDERATDVELDGPKDIAVDGDGNLYLVDGSRSAFSGGAVRRVDGDGSIASVEADRAGERFGLVPEIGYLSACAIGAGGRLYVAANGVVQRRDPDGIVTTVAGGGPAVVEEESDDAADERATDGRLGTMTPVGLVDDLAVGPGDRVFIATAGDVLELAPDGVLTTIGPFGDGDGDLGASAIAVGADGNLYVASSDGSSSAGRILRIDPEDNTSTTVAGRDQDEPIADEDVGRGDGGPARDAVLTDPSGLAVAADGTIYVSERAGIRRIDPGGTISAIFESPTVGDEGEDGSSATATSMPPAALAVAADGNLYFADQSTHQVRVIVQPADIPVPASSRWGTVVRASVILVSLVLGAVGLWRRRQLADLVRGRRQSAGADDGAQA